MGVNAFKMMSRDKRKKKKEKKTMVEYDLS